MTVLMLLTRPSEKGRIGEVSDYRKTAVNHIARTSSSLYVPTAAAFEVRQSTWSAGYWDGLDIQPTAPHHTNSGRFFTSMISFGVGRSNMLWNTNGYLNSRSGLVVKFRVARPEASSIKSPF
ncbi:hypothetical protein AVEN_257855-1 [Araneus ventricosus]|uniref:Uncharacterized protein n=1 Tax=Araneus ventricosus TaxID=182803 RepID=A0A4Y2EEI3_ARAVE|nr:hypothetical protein AVEN_257855-1 [Araneus ventricosus]